MSVETSCGGQAALARCEERFRLMESCLQAIEGGKEETGPLLEWDMFNLEAISICSQLEKTSPELKLNLDGAQDIVTLVPVVLGIGNAKLRHKLGALLHQLSVEVGRDATTLQRYTHAVVSIVTDSGTEMAISSVSGVDIRTQLCEEALALSKEAEQMGMRCCHMLPQHHFQPLVDDEGSAAADSMIPLSLCNTLFPNAIYIPGCKHVCDNMLTETWNYMEGKAQFLAELRCLESLLKPVAMRDKLLSIFWNGYEFEDKFMQSKLKKWSSSLASLRWHEVVNFISELNAISVPLRSRWHLQKFVSALPKDREAGKDIVSVWVSVISLKHTIITHNHRISQNVES